MGLATLSLAVPDHALRTCGVVWKTAYIKLVQGSEVKIKKPYTDNGL